MNTIEIQFIFGDNISLRFDRPYRFEVQEQDDLLVVEDREMSLYCFAENTESLIDEINDQIIMMWKSYVLGKKNLASCARKVRHRLIHLLEQEK
jgi:hypothetical protein